MSEKQTLILASSSPRRLALLQNIAIYPTQIISPNIDEQPLLKETPTQLALRLAEKKAMLVASSQTNAFILAADTVVGTKNKIFDKAETRELVEKYLHFFSGKRIVIYTAISVIKVQKCIIEKIATKLVVSKVKFKRFSHEEIQHYLDSNNGIGAAGGFAIQGLGETLVEWLSGSYSGIVGLPLCETANLLKGLGYHGYSQSPR